jgi:phenylalanyl-tRNA synthetase beta chain
MHANDVVEDIAIGYDYNAMAPAVPQLFTTGHTLPLTSAINTARELMIGLGLQEITSFTLSSNEALFGRMRLDRPDHVVEIENPVSQSLAVLRNWITPSLLSFLSKNTHRDYPQSIFEISEVVSIDETKETMVDSRYKMACALCHSATNFTKAKEALDAFLRNIGVTYSVVEKEHPSFLAGRSGEIVVDGVSVGIIGEIHPEVIVAWGIEMPISTFELELERLLE